MGTFKEGLKRALGADAAYRLKRNAQIIFNSRFYQYLYFSLRYPDRFRKAYARRVCRIFDYSPGILGWFREGGEHLLYEHPLNDRSVVWDVGGYVGVWSKEIHRRYRPRLHIFEPIEEFHSELAACFKGDPNVRIFQFGLGDAEATCRISYDGEQSTVFRASRPEDRTVKLRDVAEVFKELESPFIDLLSMNIEGGEYAVLRKMAQERLIERCARIQIQFHEWYPTPQESRRLRQELREELSKTHRLLFDYPFVWECWELKPRPV